MNYDELVQIEMPIIDGYKFVGYRELTLPKDNELYIYMESSDSELSYGYELGQVKNLNVNLGQRYFLYKKLEPRKITFREIRFGHCKAGDIFLKDDQGLILIWTSSIDSVEKHPILEKIHDDFNCDEDVES